MNVFQFARTAKGLPVFAFRFGQSTRKKLLLGGVHGDEVEGVVCARGVVQHFIDHPPVDVEVAVVPEFNLDGILNGTRVNGNGVDLNRNLPTKDWNPEAFNERYPPGPEANSEPENQALVKYLDETPTEFILSLHSFKRALINTNGNCDRQAELLNKRTQYPIEPTMGYPTPGCLGTYGSEDLKIPTITYELLRGMDWKEIQDVHVRAVVDAILI